jgi:hypothetical protein
VADGRTVIAAGGKALVLSLRAFASIPMLEFDEFLALGPQSPVGTTGQYLFRIESALGAVLSSMALFMVGRWFRRNFMPHD